MDNFGAEVRKAQRAAKPKSTKGVRKSPATGRPSDLTDEMAEAICIHLSEGKSLRQIHKITGMPHPGTICRWLADPRNDVFREQYARAREAQAEFYADELIDIADDSGTASKPVDVNRSRLRVDARKWVAAKLLPRKYGDKMEHSGPKGGAIPFMNLSPEENEKRIAMLEALARGDDVAEIENGG